MNFEKLKLKIKSQLSNIDFSDWSLNFLLKRNRTFLLIISLAAFSYWAYLGYNYIYYPDWSEDKKQSYIESKKEENIVLNKNRLNRVITEIENRKNNFQKSVEDIPDIFSLK